MKKGWRFPLGVVIGLFVGLLVSATFALASSPIKLIVNGKEVVCDVSPQNINGRVLVPARFVAEALGATVSWDAPNQSVVIKAQGYVDPTQIPAPRIPNVVSDLNITKDFMTTKLPLVNPMLRALGDRDIDVVTINSHIQKVSGYMSEIDQWDPTVDFEQIQIDAYQLLKNVKLALVAKQDILNGNLSDEEGVNKILHYLEQCNECTISLDLDKKALIYKGLIK
jgi:hypothetical protein